VTLTFDLLTPKSIGVFYLIRAITLWSLKPLGQRVLELLSGICFHSLGHCDLDLWPTDPKSIGVFYFIRAITLWSLKALCQRVLKLLSGNGFHSSGHCDLDLWPTDPKINRGLLLNKRYHPIKFKGSVLKGTGVIERKRSVTDGQTGKAKTICLPQRGGGEDIIINIHEFSFLLVMDFCY